MNMKLADFVVEIPIPCDLPRARGIHATTQDTFGVAIQTKCHQDERTLIDEACGYTNVKRSAFMRWCAVRVAEEICKRHRKEKGNGDGNDGKG